LQVYDIVFLRNASIPKTSSGKVRRHACQWAYQNKSLTLWKGRSTHERGTDSPSG
jgi:hypothetical protein